MKKDGVRSFSYHYTSDGWLSVIKADVYTGNDEKEATVQTYAYDDNGNKIKETYNNGAYKNYSYDKKNRVTQTESFEAPVVGESTGTRTLKTAYHYDTQDRLLEIVDYSVVGNTETAYRYTEYSYYSRGNVKSLAELSQESQPTTEEISTKKIRYVYDSEGKLTDVAYPTTKGGVQGLSYEYNETGWLTKVEADVKSGESSTGKTARSYSYDSYGKVKEIKDYRNILSAGDKAVRKTYTYDSFDRLKEMVYTDLEHPDTVMESYTYEYDKNSNITKKTEVNNYPLEGEKRINESKDYTYDALGRLIKTITTNHKKDDEKKTTIYEYDKVGNCTLENVNGKATSYIYNGLDQILTATKFQGTSVSEQIQYGYDANGNEVSQHSTKTGETTISGADQAENEICYTEGVYDRVTALYYLNARYYNPEDGRFLTEDTYRGEVREPDTQHLYAYCENNPTNYEDPSGHGIGYWSKKQKYFAYAQNAPQKYFGYYDAYDYAAKYLGININWKKFSTKNWKLEFWKGTYGNIFGYKVSSGCEIGLYYKKFLWHCAYDKKRRLRMKMALNIKKPKKELFHRDSKTSTEQGKAWWLTGFKPAVFQPGKKARKSTELSMTGTIWFTSGSKHKSDMKKLYKSFKTSKNFKVWSISGTAKSFRWDW